MSLLLMIETTAAVCSVSLADDENFLMEENCFAENSHASILHPQIEKLFLKTNRKINELSGVVLSAGPGSYTGLRVGTSAAKGFCMALNVPLIGVNTLDAMATAFMKQHQPEKKFLLCPMLDARRNEVFAGLYDADGNEITNMSS